MFAFAASLLLLQAATAQAQTQAQVQAQNSATSPSPQPCASEAHGQFDFWVGEWDVFPNGGGDQVARSSIQRLHNGCAVREQWMPLQGQGGSSLNRLDVETGRWHQLWIDSSGTTVEFEGGLVGDVMVISGYWADINGPGVDGLVRMSYTPNADGSVRQYGQVSFDHGLTWQDSFDLVYRPRAQ
ncbi:hypothetical protein GCM10009127_21690 [Alteraurantiacibacter aestuarii]|uniref:hypothetical protein n=1 Tax=Alteraurantiacibacter aestuarii TaxID=650004 RepID=UPI0031D94A06